MCDVQGLELNTIIFDSSCSRHMFSDWVKCVNGSLTKVLGVGDVGILQKVLLVPQLKKGLISEGQLAREMGWSVNAKGDWKRVLNDEGEVLVEVRMEDESNLYVVNPAYFVNNTDALYMDIAIETDKERVPFAGMVDVVEELTEQQYESRNWEWWYRLHTTPVLRGVDPIRQVRRIAWRDWNNCYDIGEETSVPRVITERYWYMSREEYQAFNPHGKTREEPYWSESETDSIRHCSGVDSQVWS